MHAWPIMASLLDSSVKHGGTYSLCRCVLEEICHHQPNKLGGEGILERWS